MALYSLSVLMCR